MKKTSKNHTKEVEKIAKHVISDTITYYNRYGVDFKEWDWREAIMDIIADALSTERPK